MRSYGNSGFGCGGGAHLVWDDALCLWSPELYLERVPRPDHLVVTVLTPAPTVECFCAGYAPHVSESYRGGF